MKRIGLFLLAATLFVGAYAAKPIAPKTDTVAIKATVVTEAEPQSAKDSMLISKLTSDQLMLLEQQKLSLEQQRIDNTGPKMPMGSSAIVLICLLPFLFVATIVFLISRAKNEESKRKYDLYMKSLEMGQTVPDHFFAEPKKSNPISNLKKGVLWLAVGLGIVVSFIVLKETDALILGIIPAFIGMGYLLVHFLEKPKTEQTNENNEQHG